MHATNYLPEVLETTEADRLPTGFIFTEGPAWQPEGYWYFVDIRQNKLFRLTPGKEPEIVRNTIGGNGKTSTCRAAWSCAKAMTAGSRGWRQTARSNRWSTTTKAGASIAPTM